MKSLTRNIIAFLCTFLFVHACSIYIMGGFDHQTIFSKFAATLLGMVIGLLVLLMLYDFRDKI